ncbi:hypothetical protein [Bacillus sp. FJAT-29937]|uniref:hypothetical protein n=1 Tax=Bacillus sp. FJAT-29937 TaxID=1720553 RepID=UPI0009E8FB31|nr:hypothetical protein [Bacillus sp. FJAT-29937]
MLEYRLLLTLPHTPTEKEEKSCTFTPLLKKFLKKGKKKHLFQIDLKELQKSSLNHLEKSAFE